MQLAPQLFPLPASVAPRHPHSFPTRRSSDLGLETERIEAGDRGGFEGTPVYMAPEVLAGQPASVRADAGWPASTSDRKSTRLNSSHVASSYAVFCLKKKTFLDNQSPPHPSKP